MSKVSHPAHSVTPGFPVAATKSLTMQEEADTPSPLNPRYSPALQRSIRILLLCFPGWRVEIMIVTLPVDSVSHVVGEVPG